MTAGDRDLQREGVEDLLRSLKAPRSQNPEPVEVLAARVLAAIAADTTHDASLIRGVCELASDPDPLVARRGQQILFANIAESLGDSFAPEAVRIHDRIFAIVVDFCRRHPQAAHVDARLTQFGIDTFEDLQRRRATLVQSAPLRGHARERLRKVFVLSRITLGADVAVTSALLDLMDRACPTARRYFVGPAGSGQLLAGVSGTETIELSYDRSGLLGRIDSWHRLTRLLERETEKLADDEWLVIDPDSRLTQLGILPVAPPGVPYRFFESRSYRATGLETIGALAAHWLSEALEVGGDQPARPRVAVAPEAAAGAQSVVSALRAGASFIVALNLGVGGNARKRITGEFELNLVRALLRDGARLIIDHGAGEDEQRVQAIASALRQEGRRVVELNQDLAGPGAAQADVLSHRGPVAPFAALVAASDLYVGYDSAFQHIAAALGTAVVDVFVNPPNEMFPRRWRPTSQAPVTVIETTADGTSEATLASVLDAVRSFQQAARG